MPTTVSLPQHADQERRRGGAGERRLHLWRQKLSRRLLYRARRSGVPVRMCWTCSSPRDHPQDFAYPGGPPLRAPMTSPATPRLSDEREVRPRAGRRPSAHAGGARRDRHAAGRPCHRHRASAGYVVSHATNNSFRRPTGCSKAKQPVYWLKGAVTVGRQPLAPGALWIRPRPRRKAIVSDAAVARSASTPMRSDAKPAGARAR